MSIEAKIAAEKNPSIAEPIQVSQQVAENLQAYRSPLCAGDTLFQSTSPECHVYANIANLQTLENRLRLAKQYQTTLDERAAFNDVMAEKLLGNPQRQIGNIVQRHARKNQMMVSMPAVYESYRCACQKYDEAHKAMLENQSSGKVAALVEQGLAKANGAIQTVESTLKSTGEAPIAK